jgi:hypothetical protein
MPELLCPLLKEQRENWEDGERVGTYEVPRECLGPSCAWWVDEKDFQGQRTGCAVKFK